jgi:signal transduction histidine kinase
MTSNQPKAPLALVVDDDPINRLLARAALESAGWNVEEAENGRDGLSAFQRLRPEVLLLDVMMPEMDGFTACAAVRKLPEGKHTPILIMTGLDDYDSITQAYNAGATDFLSKPLNGLLLGHRVRYIVRANLALRELRANQTSLAYARDAALESTRLKSEFLATVSHEIRTPMNGILGMTDWLLETQLTPEQRDCADTIRTSGGALLSIINDILDFSKLDSGKFQLEKGNFHLKQLLEDVVSPFQTRTRSKGVELSCLIQEQVPTWPHGDSRRLRQILRNLLENAVKFTERGEIVLRAEVAENSTKQSPINPSLSSTFAQAPGRTDHVISVRFSVSDTGIGIAAEAYPRIFQPFVQVNGLDARKSGGTGLGLAICRQLVQLMGGTIDVDSKPGHGSVFQFTIPFEPTVE